MGCPLAIFNLPPPIAIHMATEFPDFLEISFKILDPISHDIWCYIYVSIMALTLGMFLVLLTYKKVMPSSCGVVSSDVVFYFKFYQCMNSY